VGGGNSSAGSPTNVYSVKDNFTILYSFPSSKIVTSVIFSHDGTHLLLALGGYNKTATVYNMADGRKVNEYEIGGVVSTLSFAPRGANLLVCTMDTNVVRVYDTVEDKTLHEDAQGEPIVSVSFSVDGTQLATGGGKTLTIYDPFAFTVIQSIKWRSVISSVSWSPDGRWLAVGDWDNRATIVDVATGQSILAFKRDKMVSVVKFDPHRQVLAIGAHDNKVVLEHAPATSDNTSSTKDLSDQLNRETLKVTDEISKVEKKKKKNHKSNDTEPFSETDSASLKEKITEDFKKDLMASISEVVKYEINCLKQEINDDVKDRIGDAMLTLKNDFTSSKEELKVAVGNVKGEIAAGNSDIKGLKDDLEVNHVEIKAHVTAVKTEIAGLREELTKNNDYKMKDLLKSDVAAVKADVASVKNELKDYLKAMKTDFEDQLYDTWKKLLCILRFGSP